MDYEQHDEEMEIPKGTGVAGFLEAVKAILSLPRVQNIHINSQGKVLYSFFLRKGETMKSPSANFDKLMPYAIVRNGEVEEIKYPSSNALEACAQLFERAAVEHMYPVAFLGGEATLFWNWYKEARPGERLEDELFGLPLIRDSRMENTSLLLCTAYRRGASLTDTVKSYKITIPLKVSP